MWPGPLCFGFPFMFDTLKSLKKPMIDMKTGIGLQSLRCWVLLTLNKEPRFAYRIYALPGHMVQS